MGENELVKVDEKGRILIPSRMRDVLGMGEGSSSLLELDREKKQIRLVPLATKAEKLSRIIIRFSDSPGALAKAAKILADCGVDLIHTESRSIERGQRAEWDIIADISKADIKAVRDGLLGKKVAEGVQISPL